MGLFPSYINSTEEALNYLAGSVQGSVGGATAITTATVTLTATQTINGFLLISGGSTCAVTLPTAANVVAAFPQAVVGQRFTLEVRNNNSGIATLTTNTGNTITGTATMPTATGQRVIGVITNATAGSEAVTYYPLLTTAS